MASLRKEVASAQELTDQNLLKINYLMTSGPLTYVVMEHVEGMTSRSCAPAGVGP